jgi:hypothetical protein
LRGHDERSTARRGGDERQRGGAVTATLEAPPGTTAELLRGVAEAVALTGGGSFRWLGQDGPRLPAHLARDLDDEAVRTYLVQQLTRWLYSNFYSRGEVSAPRAGGAEGRAAHTPFVRELLAANTGRDTWQPGGTVEALRDGEVVIRRGALRVYAGPADCDPGAAALAPGVQVRLRLGRGSLRASPGFCLVVGETDLAGRGPTLRWYWHLEPAGAARFVHAATSLLNAAGLGFRLKALADPLGYDRCDAGVLYCGRDDATAVAGQLAEVYAAAGPLRATVPAFTRTVAPGLAVADDPGDGQSFGMDRCGLLARALVLAAERGLRGTEERLAVVRDVFAAAAVDLDRPHLRPGHDEADLGDLPSRLARPPSLRRPRPPQKKTKKKAPGTDWLGAAATIGTRITADAIWYRDRCQWIGAETVPGGGPGAIAYRTLPAGLYGGTAGVALFLAELAAHTGDDGARRTALGAIRQALRATTAAEPPGLYSGATGTALAAARIARVLGEDEPAERAARLAARVLRRAPVRGEHDVIYGAAGRVLGTLALGALLDTPVDDAADRLGHALLRAAERSDEGWSWSSGGLRRIRNLTGLSHGAAGASQALAVLWRHTGDAAYRDGSRAALDYERRWFDAEAANWPDFRLPPPGYPRRTGRPRCALYWCHGAPGIAQQRLSVAGLLDEPGHLDDARLAVETTATGLAESLRRRTETFSLCHGLAGNAEILAEWGRATGDAAAAGLAVEVAAEGLRRHGADGRWPCGTVRGDTPGLLLGRAGIGHFYLRLADPAVPSVLLVDAAAWARSDTRTTAPGTPR